MLDERITAYGLRQHATALTLPNTVMLRRILSRSADEIDRLTAERDELKAELNGSHWAVCRLAQIVADSATKGDVVP